MKKLVFLFAVLALVGLSASAWAQANVPGPSVTINGRITTELGYQNLSKELTTNKKDDVTTAFVNVTTGSYLRAVFTSADKATGGLIELSVGSSIGNSEAAGLRFAYGWWKVGNCTLVAGHTDNWLGSLAYAPAQVFGDRQSTKENLRLWGYYYGGRAPQVSFAYQAGNFGIQLAAVQPGAEAIVVRTGADTYATLPRFDVVAEFKAGGFATAPGFGWSQLKFQGVTGSADDSTQQWIFVLPAKFTAGPFTAKFQAHFGANMDLEWSGQKLGATKSLPQSIPLFNTAGKVYDTKQMGGTLSVEYVVGNLTVAAGYGFEKLENDLWKQSNGYKNQDYTRSAWFISFPYQVTKNFTLTPEISYYQYGDSIVTGKDNGTEWLAGFQFKFAF